MIFIILVIQFLPIGRTSGLPVFSGMEFNWEFWTASPSRALESALFTISILGFFLFITSLNDHQHERLIKFITLGFVINILVGVIQLSFGSRIIISDILPFDITSATFANENHFSSLIYIIIPLLAWRFLATGWRPLFFILITGLIVLFQFAVGSRAGMAIASGLAVFSFLWFGVAFIPLRIKQSVLIIISALVLIGIGYSISTEIQSGGARNIFFANTWKAIQDYWIFGTGLGSFVIIYPMYEAREELVHVYANHAHNDYLELFLEVGIISMAAVALFGLQIIRFASRNKLSQAAALSIWAILLHSVVDYPLRTMAIATIFAVLSAIILSQQSDRISIFSNRH